MTAYRILHVDDDPLMLEVVELSFALDPALMLMSCASGEEALAAVEGWQPHLILCDVSMPGLDGPAFLERLRESPGVGTTPVVFMTAPARSGEIEELKSLGAIAVIVKPFDPATLAATVRGHLQTVRLASASYDFSERLRSAAAALIEFRGKLHVESPALVPDDLQSFAHKLAGAAGIFGYQAVSTTASALEVAILESRAGRGNTETVKANLDALLECVERT